MSHLAALSQISTGTVLGLAVLFGLGSTGFTACGKDPQKCTKAQDGVRQSLKAGDAALVQRWREYAYKHCADRASLTALDREVADELAAADRRKSESARQKQESLALLGAFTSWAAGARATPETASANPVCEGGEAEKKSKERWCNARRMAGTHSLDARYWEKESTAARFTTVMPGPVTCQDLGPNRVIRSYTIPGTSVKRTHCELTGGALGGMQALVAEAVNGPVEVFSARFVELDPAFQGRLNNEGK
jgi:hypothetical protein